MTSLLVQDKNFYKQILKIALPIALQNMLTFAVSMMDTIMVGSLGETAISASSLANQLTFMLSVIMFGVSGGANVLISQYWGKKDTGAIHKVLAIMYRVTLALVVVFSAVALFMPESFLKIFTTDQQVIAQGVGYLKIVMWSFFFYAVTNATLGMLRSVRAVKIAIVVYTVSLLVNTFFNWIFIFGKLGAPAMGVRGAALGTVIARIVEFVIVAVYMFKVDDKIKLTLKSLLPTDKMMVKDYAVNSLPVVCNEMLWGIGASIVSIVVARMGTEVVAANSICNVAMQLVSVMIFGISASAQVIVGNTIGAQDYEKLHQVRVTLQIFGIAIGVVAAVMMLAMRPIMAVLYNVSDLTKVYTGQLMTVTAFLMLFRGAENVNMMGILRGGGDARFVLFADLIFMWTLAIPLGFFAAFKLHWPVAAVFIVLKIDEILKTFLSFWRLRNNNWVRNVTR